ncbi:hypothetical protein IX317_001962 [Fusobacterium sp. DD29]|uniref:hypothetical protein n=1 Tax=unclassified Fusobacterium TaxID=2648384 RepID=UPI001B8B71AE|nr:MULTISPECIES: hypothetical protein [unclassified Fusobacterium]MBR8700455.1 hypothetical protein [Fusobacterium sp. DD45]MBR8710204.1 hypothetical protein [Fusobacterium sp. DD28]MBR8750265.1 hypothetical protein [Fusobacterium sp. DD29]MBR8750695.1 hypothetical protein [Fusobacterium sp. DD26]MBR8762506.1 hypothetical protein [Fusobacterium sp. DD25]
MGIEKNLRYINEEYEQEVARLERLNNFINSKEFETGTDAEQKKLLLEKQEVLKKYVSIIAEQMKYDRKKVQDEEFDVSNYDDIEKSHFHKK